MLFLRIPKWGKKETTKKAKTQRHISIWKMLSKDFYRHSMKTEKKKFHL